MGIFPDPKYGNGGGDVFYGLLANKFASDRDFVLNLLVGATRYANAAARCQCFDSGRDIDTITVYAITILDDIAQIDADSESHLAIGGQRIITCFQFILNLKGTLNGIDNTGKFCQQVVARRIDNPSMVTADQAAYDGSAGLECDHGVGLVQAHQTTVALDVRTQYRRKLSIKLMIWHESLSRHLDKGFEPR